ncbi:putative serine/threonine-protein kinase iks1 [Sorochytrium milnesiophthora]
MPTNNGHGSADEMSASDTQELDHDHGDMALSNRQDWMVILRNAATQQVVLYNKTDPKLVIMPSRRLSRQQEHPPNDFMDKNYFRLLSLMPLHEPVVVDNEATHSDTADDPTVAAGATATTTAATEQPQDGHLASHSFNQGYYSRFFVELRKLGRGLRGSVFLCQHILDDIYLGEYAIKKVAVGDNHPWLARMLREVHLLEKLHHPNIINYKHAWLENHQHSAFGPQIPSLFILMECANGGNLEEYIDIEERVRVELAAMTPRERARRVRKDSTQAWPGREQAIVTGGIGLDSMGRKVRFLKTDEILSLLYDIASGLEHLHKHGIIHRDLKPPNLLLSFADPNNKNQTPRVLISDFGECEMLGEDALRARTGATGTIDFTAPELLENYSQKADIWSLGLILYYLCFSALPYRQVDDVEQLRSEILAFNG